MNRQIVAAALTAAVILSVTGCATQAPTGPQSATQTPTITVCGSVVTFDTSAETNHTTFQVATPQGPTSITVHSGTVFTYDFQTSPLTVSGHGTIVRSTCITD